MISFFKSFNTKHANFEFLINSINLSILMVARGRRVEVLGSQVVGRVQNWLLWTLSLLLRNQIGCYEHKGDCCVLLRILNLLTMCDVQRQGCDMRQSIFVRRLASVQSNCDVQCTLRRLASVLRRLASIVTFSVVTTFSGATTSM